MGLDITISGTDLQLEGNNVAVTNSAFDLVSWDATNGQNAYTRQIVKAYLGMRKKLAVVLQSPADTASGIDDTADLTVEFKGGYAGDGATLRLDTQNDFLSGGAITIAQNNYRGGVGKIVIPNANMAAATTYYWRIEIATLDDDGPILSSVFSFDTA